MTNAERGYIRYLGIAKRHQILPAFPCDVFNNGSSPSASELCQSSLQGQLEILTHRWVESSGVRVSGMGSATILLAFGASVKNLHIHVQDGSFFVLIGPHSTLQDITLQASGDRNSVYLGAHVSASRCNFLSQGDDNYIFIGNDCMLSTDVHIRNSDSHSIFDYTTKNRFNIDKPVVIADHCWIGRSVTIGKGSHVNDDIVIGQGSLVSGSLTESHSIYAGIPAKQIRGNATWDRSRALSVEEIAMTMQHRPRQKMCHEFLTQIKPTLPLPFEHSLDRLHHESVPKKKYPWIDLMQ